MTKGRTASGYTILEVLIFLAISGLLFASAIVAVNGYQRNIQYSQAVRDFEVQIKDVINDVRDGYYPDYDFGTCTVGADGPEFSDDPTDPAQGSNSNCINIGKTVMFRLNDRENDIAVGTIVGLNPRIDDDALSLGLTDLKPTMAYEPGDIMDLTTYKPIRFGVEVTKIASVDDPNIQYSSISFISGFTGGTAAVDSRSNGTLSVDVYGYHGGSSASIPVSADLTDHKNIIKSFASDTNYDRNPEGGIYICLLTTDNRRARVIIGVDGVTTATKTEYDLDPGTVCP